MMTTSVMFLVEFTKARQQDMLQSAGARTKKSAEAER